MHPSTYGCRSWGSSHQVSLLLSPLCPIRMQERRVSFLLTGIGLEQTQHRLHGSFLPQRAGSQDLPVSAGGRLQPRPSRLAVTSMKNLMPESECLMWHMHRRGAAAASPARHFCHFKCQRTGITDGTNYLFLLFKAAWVMEVAENLLHSEPTSHFFGGSSAAGSRSALLTIPRQFLSASSGGLRQHISHDPPFTGCVAQKTPASAHPSHFYGRGRIRSVGAALGKAGVFLVCADNSPSSVLLTQDTTETR